MPPTFRADSIFADSGRPPRGWDIVRVPWPGEVDIPHGEVYDRDWRPTLALAWVRARELRRQYGVNSCWYIRWAVFP